MSRRSWQRAIATVRAGEVRGDHGELDRRASQEKRDQGRELLADCRPKWVRAMLSGFVAVNDPLMRDFYAGKCRVQRWSVRTLRQKIGALLFERRPVA